MARAVHSEAQQSPDGRQQRVVAPDVQERVLLAGEARVVEVFGGGGRADRDGRAQLLAGGQQFACHLVRDRGGEQGADAGRRTVRPLRVGEGGEDPLADAGGGDVRPVRVGGEHDAGRDREAGPGQLAEVRALAARERQIAAPDIGQLPEVPHGTSVDLPSDKMPPQGSGSATPGRGCGRRGGETIRPAGGTAAPPPRPSARTAGRPATSCRAARARGSRRGRRRPAAA